MLDALIELDFTTLEASDLMGAVSRECACAPHDQAGIIECAGHRSLSDLSGLKRLLFARRLRDRWRSGEFDVSCRKSAVRERSVGARFSERDRSVQARKRI